MNWPQLHCTHSSGRMIDRRRTYDCRHRLSQLRDERGVGSGGVPAVYAKDALYANAQAITDSILRTLQS